MANKKDKEINDAIEIVGALAAIQAERRAHDKQTKDQTVDAIDILDKKRK